MKLKVLLFIQIFCVVISALAEQTGKIAGKIVDSKTKAPLASANILLEGTHLGASSDLEGEYYILNVSPGRYTIRTSIIGYAKKTISGVVVFSGQTTWLNLELEPSIFEMEEVTVNWEQPPLNLQETSMRATVSQDEIANLPIETLEKVLEVQAGVAVDANGELHLRGGRSGEIIYYIDGQRVEDPLEGRSQLTVNREAVEELTVLSGSFNAEYGEAMSGVVQIITREGGEDYSFDVEYLSSMLNSSPYRQEDWVRSGSDAVRDNTSGESLYRPTSVFNQPTNILPLNGRLHLALSGPLSKTKKFTLFTSAIIRNEDSYLPFGFEQERTLTGKVVWNENEMDKFAIKSSWSYNRYQNYNHTWKYVPEHYHKHFVHDFRSDASWTHTSSKDLYFTLRSGIQYQKHEVKIFEDWEDYISAGYQPEDFTFASYFYDENDWSDTWRESETTTQSFAGEANYQYGNHHQLKGGVETRFLDIDMLDIRELNIGANNEQTGIIDVYDEQPLELSAYIQDKIELSYLVVNAGMRWDYVDPNSQGWSNPEDPESALQDAPISRQFSPRLGLAHPISDKVSLYFAYGHFFQYPYYSNLFMNSVDLSPDTLSNRAFDAVGNRMLRPQKTIAYEIGLKGNVSDDVGFTFTAFYKDITDLVGTKQVRYGAQYHYALFRNIDYASVKGFEIGLTRRLKNGWSLEGNYTYSVAKGNSSEPLQGFWNAYYEMPEAQQEYYLDFDRTHIFNAMAIWQSGTRKGEWKERILSDISLGVIASFASGMPYTPYTGAGEALAAPNSARMDPSATVDIRFSKILWQKRTKATLLVLMDNLFDFTNDLVVNTQTGEPWETPIEGNEITFDQIHDPSRVDSPRIIKAGIKVEL
jgi:outer membrane receptor protein involved in Fe transport